MSKYISSQLPLGGDQLLDMDCLRKGVLLSKMAPCQQGKFSRGWDRKLSSSDSTAGGWFNNIFIKRGPNGLHPVYHTVFNK